MLALFCCATFLWFLMKKHFELTLIILAQDTPSERGGVKSFESKVKKLNFTLQHHRVFQSQSQTWRSPTLSQSNLHSPSHSWFKNYTNVSSTCIFQTFHQVLASHCSVFIFHYHYSSYLDVGLLLSSYKEIWSIINNVLPSFLFLLLTFFFSKVKKFLCCWK